MIGQDPRPISSGDYVKKFETRMTPNHLFQLISEINKPTDLTKEPDTVDYRELQRQAIRDMGFGTLLDLKIKNIPTALCNFLACNFQTGARQVPLNGNNVLDIKQEDVIAVLDLPRGPKLVEELKQNDPAITDHAEMVDAFKKRMGYSNKFLPTRSTAAQLIAGRKDFGDDFKRDFLVFVDLAALYEKFYQLIITMSKTVLDIREKEMELRIELDEQEKQIIKILTDAMVSMSRKMPPPSGTTQLEQEQQQHQQDLQDAQICELCEMAWKSAESRFATIIEQLQRQVADQQEQQQHQQTDDNTWGYVPTSKEVVVDERQTQLQGAQGLDQLSQTNDENSLPVGKSVPTSKEVLVDEQQTQPQEHATNVSTTEKKRSHQDSTGRDSGVTSTYTKRSRSTGTRKRKALKDATIPSFNLGIFSSQEDSYETTQEKNTQEDVTVTVDLDKDVNETIEAEEYPVPSALDETKNPSPSIDEIIRRASAPASESLSDTEKLEIIAAVAEQVEKNPKVVEAVPLSIIPPDWNVASTTGGLLMLDKNECTTPPPAISKKAEVHDEGLTKTVEKILNQKPRRRNPPRIHRLPERFRSPFMLQKKNKKKFIQLTEEKKKMT
ncbi:OLC1v1001387C1 [Oldenlandia corymbosa var. corymbosa]|uniref:OLC1v1001387C1 n=1 Tax=Oldenlandia corymbosa var. corymbosa TaxID=529605 RepID=A0AAV1D6S1_OLDCO|nr:OLC1v1001387C1 [Oldenlandia corymbosa var. corymbosa]